MRATLTDADGNYLVPGLLPSEYSLKAEKPGFKTFLAKEVVVPVGGDIRVDFALEVGQVTEQVTVEAAVALLETESTALSHIMNEKRIVDLPLNGRNFLELAALSAGAIPKLANRSTQYGNRNQYVTVGGGRDSSTNYLIDGIEARSLRFNNSSLQPSIDAIQEFKVERNAFSAEYGRRVGVVNVAIRSGSNQFHGSVFEFFRNDKLDARNTWRLIGRSRNRSSKKCLTISRVFYVPTFPSMASRIWGSSSARSAFLRMCSMRGPHVSAQIFLKTSRTNKAHMRRVEERFSWASIAQRTEHAYRDVIEEFRQSKLAD